VSGQFGGGDSQQNPTTLVGMNINGQVVILFLHPNDAAKNVTITGPNLVQRGFPDPLHANVVLAVGDYNHDGHLDLQITLLSTSFDVPFLHRVQMTYILYGDGAGRLKQQGG
jgi:hypothetical protein